MFAGDLSLCLVLTIAAILPIISAKSNEFISGHAFYNLAQWNTETLYRVNFNPSSVFKDGDIIFFHCMQGLESKWLKRLRQEHSETKNKYTFIAHNCDWSFTRSPQDLEVLKQFIHRIYTVNNACGKACFPFVQTIPIGFVDSHLHPDKAHHVFEEVASRALPKEHLVFMNFKMHDVQSRHRTIPDPKRAQCRDYFADKPWVLFKDAGLSPPETYALTAKAKYVVSPRGAGTDCHRIYEAIYLGAVPIVESFDLDHFYGHLPVIIVDEWSDITESYLIENYATHKQMLDDWKAKYSNWTQPEFWMSGGDLGPFGGGEG